MATPQLVPMAVAKRLPSWAFSYCIPSQSGCCLCWIQCTGVYGSDPAHWSVAPTLIQPVGPGEFDICALNKYLRIFPIFSIGFTVAFVLGRGSMKCGGRRRIISQNLYERAAVHLSGCSLYFPNVIVVTVSCPMEVVAEFLVTDTLQ